MLQVLLNQLYRMKRELLYIRKSTWPLREAIGGLERGESKLLKKKTSAYIRDLYDHTIQVIDTVETFRDMLAARVRTLISGDPKQRDTFIGPMISVREAQRLKSWIDDAVAGGARLLAGGGCEGNMLEATLLEHGHDQADAVQDLMRSQGWLNVQSRLDKAGIRRCTGGSTAGMK